MASSSLSSVIVICACFVACFALSTVRDKREAFDLTDGIEFYIGSIKTNFICTSGGYFADMDNNCQLFHVCVPQEFPDGRQEIAQYTFACGNQTVFNQFSMTCAHESEAIPCSQSAEFFYLNERLGNEKEQIHQENDVNKYSSAIGRQ